MTETYPEQVDTFKVIGRLVRGISYELPERRLSG